jgi:hypothetical protein
MGIEKPAFYSSSAEYDPQVVVQFVGVRPTALQPLDTPVEANRLVGYYDATKGVVELFVSAPDGSYWMRVTG